MFGLVPDFETREAAVYCHYTWPEWLALEPYDRALCVAQYRLHYLIEAHANDAVAPKQQSQE